MFYTLDLRTARWWMAGMLAGLAGWALWTGVERVRPLRNPAPLAFERQFWPASTAGPQGAQPALQQPGEPTGASGPSAEPRPVAAAPGLEPGSGQQAGPSGTAPLRRNPDALRAERERLRSREMELASRVLEDPNASDARKAQAQLELVQLLQRSRREVEIEQLLLASGVDGAVVNIGEAGVQVVVPQTLSVQGAARIGELVARMAGVRREQISIVDNMTVLAGPGARQESP